MQTEIGAQLYICDPTQTYFAVFNNSADPNFVGYVTDITGFDSPEVRENAQDINAGDGGYHGPFWHGRRPWTLSGMIVPTTPVVARSAAMTKIDVVMNACTKQDGWLIYTPSDEITRYLNFRKQTPQRITAGQSAVQKEFQIGGVCRDWRFYTSGTPNYNQFSTSGGNIVGNGNALAPAKWVFNGPADGVFLYNRTSGKNVEMYQMPTGTIPSGDALVLDLTGQYPACYRQSDGLDLYGYINPIVSDLGIGVIPGNNNFQFDAYNGSASNTCEIYYNDAWN